MMTKFKHKIIVVVLIFFLIPVSKSQAQPTYQIEPEESFIRGSVKYTVVGKYVARFEQFEGQVVFDPDDQSKNFVRLVIDVPSIKSKFKTLDDIVRSKKLLDARRFPKISFESERWEKTKKGYLVYGTLYMHGQRGALKFPFQLKEPKRDELGRYFLEAQGKWVVNRKDFDIYWSRILDKGGVIVGNHITVDWKIRAYLKS